MIAVSTALGVEESDEKDLDGIILRVISPPSLRYCQTTSACDALVCPSFLRREGSVRPLTAQVSLFFCKNLVILSFSYLLMSGISPVVIHC